MRTSLVDHEPKINRREEKQVGCNTVMTKLGIIQTASYPSNKIAINKVAVLLKSLGKKETDIVCLPEQWLKNNQIQNFDSEFAPFKNIAKEYSMTVIPGAFYERKSKKFAITAPIIGPTGNIIGRQDKIHPFDYENKLIKPGRQAKVFKTSCKFGIVICYDLVFSDVSNTLVRKGAEVLLSPSRIVRRGIQPWHLYTQVRALENRVPILAANMQNYRFGGQSMVVDLVENDRVMIPKILAKLKGEKAVAFNFNLNRYKKSRKIRFADAKRFS
jgi:omega-amidase